MSAAAQLVVLGDASAFCAVTTVAHCEDFVQVTIHDLTGDRTYARPVRQRHGQFAALRWSASMAVQVREVADLVSTPALIAWLLDSGFSLNQ